MSSPAQFDKFGFIAPSETSLGEVYRSLDKNFNAVRTKINAPVTGCRVYNSANLSIPDSTLTTITYDSETFDNGPLHSLVTNPERLTCNDAGIYLIVLTIRFASAAGGTQRNFRILLNGTTIIGLKQVAIPAGTLDDNLTCVYPLKVGDYLTSVVFQDSGGALNALALFNSAPTFSAVKLS